MTFGRSVACLLGLRTGSFPTPSASRTSISPFGGGASAALVAAAGRCGPR